MSDPIINKDKVRDFTLTTAALKNKNTIFLITVLFGLFGIISYTSLPKELFPDIVIPTVMVQTIYPETRLLIWKTLSPGHWKPKLIP
jgi:hypothetical protein